MEQNLFEPRSIVSIAAELGVSVRQLERGFHAHLRRSPQQVYMALRLRHAQWMLINTPLTASRVAAEFGFSDSAHFNRCFKAQYGATPAKFRYQALSGARPSSRDARHMEYNQDRRVFD
jgi:transcriptional regulator GlxA family with amidase domain